MVNLYLTWVAANLLIATAQIQLWIQTLKQKSIAGSLLLFPLLCNANNQDVKCRVAALYQLTALPDCKEIKTRRQFSSSRGRLALFVYVTAANRRTLHIRLTDPTAIDEYSAHHK